MSISGLGVIDEATLELHRGFTILTGEPGAGTDTFKIVLSNGYSASNTLGGGNIQLHKPCVS